ncbi:hypothetical protein NDU88_007792 [Pleurodeles waltl]|uniref:Uncharacterized protein n=1 Tax=Pleurodeles waltl TaxID=8319 RepID=A0AAV7VUN6_PLEWA|nr:hypothetical protein NDU88_007792 [Pleurodeles waltl]
MVGALGLGSRPCTSEGCLRRVSSGPDQPDFRPRGAADSAAPPEGVSVPAHMGPPRLLPSGQGSGSHSLPSTMRSAHVDQARAPAQSAAPFPAASHGHHITDGSGPVHHGPPGPGRSRSPGQSGSRLSWGSFRNS